MKGFWQKLVSWLISPMAIGIYLTLLVVKLTFSFYGHMNDAGDATKREGFSDQLLAVHQKSIDYRLRVRGPRPVDPNIALLAVDERAVATLGRWPWPRSVMAKGIENAMKYGARVIAFDIGFAEASANPAEAVLEALKTGRLQPQVEKAIQAVHDDLDSDRALGRVFSQYSDRIVAGAFTTAAFRAKWPPETEFCRDLIYRETPAAKQWHQEAVLMMAQDPFQTYMPKALTDLFSDVLKMKADEVRNNYGPIHSKSDEVLAAERVLYEQHDLCDKILNSFKNEISEQWNDVVLAHEDPKEFSFATYEEWLEDYRRRSFPNAVLHAEGWNLNTPVIAQGTKHTGYFNTEQDPDGTIRGKALVMRTGSTYFPALSLKAFTIANDYNATAVIDYNPATGMKEVKGIDIASNETGDTVMHVPTDSGGKLLLNYAGPQKMYPFLSFADLVSDSPDAQIEQRVWNPAEKEWMIETKRVNKADFIKNKIFVAGATAQGIYDLRVTPFEENYPGAETHLNAIDNLLNRSFLRTLPDEPIYMPFVLLGIGLCLSLALTYLGALWGLVLTSASLVGITFFDQYYLFNKGIVVAVIWPLFFIVVLYMTLTFYRYFTEERSKKELRQTFQKYVSPAIVEEILADPANIQLGGRKSNLTVFFSDVRGFTTISEKLDPRALSDLLNSYLTPMTELVFANRGTLDKYMGDAVMAFFGAPISYADHAKYACRCALLSVKKAMELRQAFEKQGLPPIDLGIGLNTGEVSVGNMGSETVRSYTVMGDAVNLASRLEGINKEYGTRIVLSEMTYKNAKDNFVCREIDWVRVKGKLQPVKIFELIAEEKAPSAQIAETLKWFQEGYNFYHEQAWDKALKSFSQGLQHTPDDPVSKLYIQRCQDYIQEPPADGWDGVYTMKTK